jgi:hypothetical protein
MKQGNAEFKCGNYRDAINVSRVFSALNFFNTLPKLYTRALQCVHPTTLIELQRTMLANRAQTWVSYGGLAQEALRDIDHALSPQYTNSAETNTTKYRFLRAELLCLIARYDEAHTEHTKLVNLIRKSKLELGSNFKLDQLAREITSGAKADQNSERRRKDELLRAVDVCHLRDIFYSVNIDQLFTGSRAASSYALS